MFPIKKRYNEYKYLIHHYNLNNVISMLDNVARNTDPYPEGIVESCYYDSLSMKTLHQCMDGDARKIKFRIRRYDNDMQGQLQIKSKNIYGVGKLKSILPHWEIYNNWHEACEVSTGGDLHQIRNLSRTYQMLYPVINVRYVRRRYQFAGCRITIDSQIEGSRYQGLRYAQKSFAKCYCSVLEIKTESAGVFLPGILKGLVKYGSFSKFAFLTRDLLGEHQ